MESAGSEVSLHRYANTTHWFAEPDRPEHDDPAAALAWRRTTDFLLDRRHQEAKQRSWTSKGLEP